MISRRIKNLEPSPTITLDAKVKQLQAAGISVVNFTLGEPDFTTPKHIRQAAIQAIEGGFTHYTPSAGILELRELIVRKLAKENGISYETSEVIVGVGTKQLLYSVFQVLCQKGDEVLVPTPTWSTYVEQIKLAEGKPVLVPLQPPFKLTAKELEKYVTSRTKIILLNSPSNPTGTTISKEELEKIAKLAVQRKIFVISDEIYEKIFYGGKHLSIASLGKEIKQLTITINGFSKAYAMTGWRVGYAAGPSEIISGMVAFSGQTTFGTSSISQKAAVGAYSGSQKSVEEMVKEFRKRRDFLFHELSKIKGISVQKPEGAFYLFPNIERLLGQKYPSSAYWAEKLLEEAKVAVIPGEAFFAPGYIRLSFTIPLSQIKEGVSRIKKFVEKRKIFVIK